MQYLISSTTGTFLATTHFNNVEENAGTLRFSTLDADTVASRNVFIKAFNEHGTEVYSDQIVINVVCGLASTVITEGAYTPSTLGVEQFVAANDLAGADPTKFILPRYVSAESNCPI